MAILLRNGCWPLRVHHPIRGNFSDPCSVSEGLPSSTGPGHVLVGGAVRLTDGRTVPLLQHRPCRSPLCAPPWLNWERLTAARVSCHLPNISVPRRLVAELILEIASSISVIKSVDIASKCCNYSAASCKIRHWHLTPSAPSSCTKDSSLMYRSADFIHTVIREGCQDQRVV